jgi:hypothetical protein
LTGRVCPRSRLSSRRLEVDFGQFAALSVDGRYLRKRDMAQSDWSRREADIANCNDGRTSCTLAVQMRIVDARIGVAEPGRRSGVHSSGSAP